MASRRAPRAERVRRAAGKFSLQTEDVEAALDRIEKEVRERRRRSMQDFLGTKAERHHVRSLADAAAKTLAYARSDNLPIGLRSMIAASEMLEMLHSLNDLCREVLRSSTITKRDDGFEKRLAAREALLLLPPPRSTRRWHGLAAILYGSDDAADVRRACRTLREQLPGKRAQAERDLERLKAELTVAEAELRRLREEALTGAK
jgi:hypothetical protein